MVMMISVFVLTSSPPSVCVHSQEEYEVEEDEEQDD